MTPTVAQHDPLLTAVAQLRSCDLDRGRTDHLRLRCHAVLTRHERRARRFFDEALWRRTVGPALVGAWCAIYLVETIRRAAAIYGF